MTETECVYCAVRTACLIKPLKPHGHFAYHQFNIQQLYVLPTQCICILYGSENKQRLFPSIVLTDWFL